MSRRGVEITCAVSYLRGSLEVQFLPAMRSVVFLLALAGLALVHAVEVEEEENVLILTQANFKQVIDENNYVLVEFCKCSTPLCVPSVHY